MLTRDKTPQEIAQILIESDVKIEEYQVIQDRRIERLKLWKERNVQVLIDQEQELINFGEEVLNIMKKS